MSACKRLVCLVKQRSLWAPTRRNVSTWSPVGTAFNARPHKRQDFFEKSVVSLTELPTRLKGETRRWCLLVAGFVRSARAQLPRGVPGRREDGVEEHGAPGGAGLLLSCGRWDGGVLWPAVRRAVQSGGSGESNTNKRNFAAKLEQIRCATMIFKKKT